MNSLTSKNVYINEESGETKILLNNQTMAETQIDMFAPPSELKYLPPEVLEDQQTTLSSKWWALGIMMYE